MRVFLLSVGVMLASALMSARGETNARRALSLLTRWCDAIERYQVKSPDDPHVKGSVLCPACALQHGRICDVVYPMTYLWTRTGNAKYLDCARAAVAWSRYNLTDMGGARHHNDFQGQWWGITVFSQCAVGKTLLAFGDKLPEDVRAGWRTWFDLQTGFVFEALDQDGVFNVNYSAAFCEAMALAWKLTGDEKFRAKARETAAKLEAYFLPDGMLAGEKHPPTFVSPRGFRAVDIGYNAEESLPSLFHYAELVDDEAYAAKLEPLGRGILEFVLPDGGLDNSMGSRLCKWTYYGSRTSDGMLPLFADLVKRGVPGALRAIIRHLDLLERCTSRKSGLLAGGLHYDEADEGACVHHAFAHAKSLVDFLLSGATDAPDTTELPRERPYGIREFSSFGTTLVSTEDWCASFSLNDVHHNSAGTDCGGGSMTLLWSRRLDAPVLAGTMLRYAAIERENMQEQRQDRETRSMMPRIESGELTSVADSQAVGSAVKEGNAVTYRAEGFLSAEGGIRSKRPFALAYTLDGSTASVAAKAAGNWRYVLPVVALPSDDVRIDGCRATIRRSQGTVEVTASAPIVLERTMRGARAFTPVTGLFAAYLTVAAPTDGEVSVTISVAGNERKN